MTDTVTFDQATRRFPKTDRPAVDHLDLHVAGGEFLVLVGPSGCGKSTCLRMLAGLDSVDEGRILIGDRDVSELPPKQRDIAMVFQNYALYPHMTVAQNMGFALKIAHVPKSEVRQRVVDVARMLNLESYLNRRPAELSGGQRQRVAMGRAIIRRPRVFLLDEPLSNLDAKLRAATRTQLAGLQRQLGVTTIYVTHDQVEAMTMGDRVAVLNDGVLQQIDTPQTLYAEPVNTFVAAFIGSPSMNLLPGRTTPDGVVMEGVVLPVRAATTGGAEVTVGFRPESVTLVAPSTPGAFPATVALVEPLGADTYIYVTVGAGPRHPPVDRYDVVARIPPGTATAPADVVNLCVDPRAVYLFDAATKMRLGGLQRDLASSG